jgi:hypothetical protein
MLAANRVMVRAYRDETVSVTTILSPARIWSATLDKAVFQKDVSQPNSA